jgi:hypothetical protein
VAVTAEAFSGRKPAPPEAADASVDRLQGIYTEW